MDKLKNIMAEWKSEIKKATSEFVWFNKSKKTEVDGSEVWINKPINVSEISDVLSDDDNWFVNIFIKEDDKAVEEVSSIREELAKLKMEIVPETEFSCKNQVIRYAIRTNKS